MSELTERAESIGTTHGHNAGTWIFDGNTSRATYAHILKGIEEGDPMVLDSLTAPSLYGTEYTEESLAAELGVTELSDDCRDAYNDAADQAFWNEVERAARYQLGD